MRNQDPPRKQEGNLLSSREAHTKSTNSTLKNYRLPKIKHLCHGPEFSYVIYYEIYKQVNISCGL